MGTRNSRPEQGKRRSSLGESPSASTRFTAPLCSPTSSSVAYREAHKNPQSEPRGGSTRQHGRCVRADHETSAVATRREAAAREQSSNYFSNDYKRQLSLRKAALRQEKERRSSANALTAHLSKEDMYSVTDAPSDRSGNTVPISLTVRRSKAPSVLSETSVHTVAHKPIFRQNNGGGGAGGAASSGRRRPVPSAAPPRRLRWPDNADVTREARYREGGPVGFVPIFAYESPPTDSTNWNCDFGGGDCGFGGGDCGNAASF